MWVLGMGVGLVAFVVGAVFSILAFMDGTGLDGMLPGFALAAVGNVMLWGFLVWGLACRRGIPDE